VNRETSHPIYDSLPEDEVLKPVIVDPIIGDDATGFIANIYQRDGIPGDEELDFRSQDRANLYLLGRDAGVADPGPGKKVKAATGYRSSTPETVADDKNKRRWVAALGLSLLSLVGVNIVVNAKPLSRDVASFLNTFREPTKPVAIMSPAKDNTLSFKIGESEGLNTPPHASITSLDNKLRLTSEKEKIASISVTGNTSPEYGTNDRATLYSNPNNKYLGLKRADQVLADIVKLDPALSSVPTKVNQAEHTLTAEQYKSLENLARENGYSSFLGALYDVQNGVDKSKSLTNAINHYFLNPSIRGVNVRVSLRPETSSANSGNQSDGNLKFIPYFIPVPPIRRKKARQDALPKKSLPGLSQLYGEKVIPISSENFEWVAQADNQFSQYKEGDIVESYPWALTRKYAIAMRELKFSNVLNMEYTDSFSEDMQSKMLFLEKQPSELLQNTLQTMFSRAVDYTQGGIGRQLKTVSVLRKHENVHYEDRLAFLELGIDENLPGASVAYYPTLELLEVLLPNEMNEEQVLKENGGPIWMVAERLAQIILDRTKFISQSIKISGRSSVTSDIMYHPQSVNEKPSIFAPEDQEKIVIAERLILTSWLSGIEYTNEQRTFIDDTFADTKKKYDEAGIIQLLYKFQIPEIISPIDITYSMREAKADPQIRALIVHSQIGKIALGGLNSWQLIPRSVL